MKELKETQRNYLVIHVFAGHAVRPNHETFFLTNGFDVDTGFYELFNAEHVIKQIATDNPYSYHIAVLAGRLKQKKNDFLSFELAKQVAKGQMEVYRKDLEEQARPKPPQQDDFRA